MDYDIEALLQGSAGSKGEGMFSERLKKLKAYVPGEQPQDRKYIKLNTNESPYPPSPGVRDLLAGFDAGRLRLYPDPQAGRLRERLAEVYGVDREMVFVGNGSDETLSFCFYAFFDSSRGSLLFPAFTYSFYPVYCDFYGIDYERVPLAGDFSVRVEEYLGRDSCGIIIANPNAPTGISLPLERIRYLLDRYPEDKAVILDEAYVDFGAETALPAVREHGNLLIARTFSKGMSLAGIRLGFVIGHESLIHALTTVKDSFNSYPVSMLSQLIAETALQDEGYYRIMRQKITATRQNFSSELQGLGWDVLPSKANFVFARKRGVSGGEVYRTLKQKGILVRHFDLEGIRDFVRITIGTDEDMRVLLDELGEWK
ncbi:MAG: histidinol-phosphate transaminase [Thermodesulfobacteriota bacterium]